MVPCDVSVPRANGMFVSPDGGVAQLGATVTATVTAVTTLASPTLSSALLMARFMLPPDLLASLHGYAARHPDNPGGLAPPVQCGPVGARLDWAWTGRLERRNRCGIVRGRGVGGWVRPTTGPCPAAGKATCHRQGLQVSSGHLGRADQPLHPAAAPARATPTWPDTRC